MWSRSYSELVKDVPAAQVWKVWANVNQWHTWQDDIEYASLEGEFKTGNVIRFKPKGGPAIDIALTRVEPDAVFVDLTKFFLARMVDSHELIPRGGELEIRSTVSIDGPLAFFWRKVVAENVANGMQEQTARLIERARNA